MKLLLDTCTFLWAITGDPQLSDAARRLIIDPDNEVALSAVSAWEIAVKHALGRLPLPEEPARFVPAERARHGIEALPLDEAAALHVRRLPPLHRDPFDRMLVSQALVGGLALVTPDPLIAQYPVRICW
ncbi:MAG TPA: type II toxin-antitoxin system VapC family toxin [Polyangia bacterium]